MFCLSLLSLLLSAIVNASPIARSIGHRGGIILSLSLTFVALVAGVTVWYEVVIGDCGVYFDYLGTWFSVGTMNIVWEAYYDIFSAHMLLTVTVVSFAVHCFAVVYMKSDPHLNLFLGYLSAFTFFMVVLISGSNMLLMFVGFEGIGVCSYLLIGYWSHRLAASKSALKAIVVNRISDGLLLWSIIWLWWYTGSLEYDLILLNDSNNITNLLGITILLGCAAKSVQIVLHVWLADSMEGPTPVSALIHAATLVTAGVYVMVRLSIFDNTLVLIVGSLTAIMGGIFGLFQNDLKRVIAFSTCSQLGYMMASIGLGELGVEASMSHLMSHASFKAGLFLAAGVVITSAGGYQHIGRYGGLSGSHCTLFGYLTLLLCGLSLMGLPETSGFYSKETIINISYVYFHPFADYAHTLLLLAALVTCTYTVKLFIQAFCYDFSGLDFNISPASKPMSLLLAVAFSVLLLDIVAKVWVGTSLLSGILFFVPWLVKTLPAGLIIAGILTATSAVTSQSFSIIRFNATRWGFDQLFARTFVVAIMDWGRITWTAGDKGLFAVNNQKVRF
uniref:NADH-ubiquinone oxidoreductase chain 5 n=1 Tax=Dunaliella viridis TaxID=140095 RepID=A0A0C5C0L4_9CHLO|nr:NADH dehydrogenase subunit 5 [Dunaliella viridis]AJN90458.1 NADH dehydrogenase subunit 5 [Dunaliella viridis]